MRALLLGAAAALAAAVGSPDSYGPFVFPNRAGIALFDAAKFGLFVHWGPVSQWGTEISFPLVCRAFPCTVAGPGNVPVVITNATALSAHRAAYAALAQTFNPVAFNASALADIAYAAGFRYLTYTAEHCDGFSGWNSSLNYAYSSVGSPWGRDIVGELMPAFRARGLRAGVYFCPSTWNSDDYFYPDALTSFGDCCSPNYDPLASAENAAVWARYVAKLHGRFLELAQQYAPSHFWVDSGTYPPSVDTQLEAIMPALRAANPEVVVHVRDGGVWHDYVSTGDHSEIAVDAIMGVPYLSVTGDKFEVPGTLGEQWAYDPRATYKDAPTVIRELIAIVSKGGNYLMNIGLNERGVWADAALATLAGMTAWFAFAGESIHGTAPQWPYAYAEGDGPELFFVQAAAQPWTYVSFWALPASRVITVSSYKAATLRAPPARVRRLTSAGAVDVPFSLGPLGLAVNLSASLPPAPPDGAVALNTYLLRINASRVDRAPCGLRDCSVYTSDGYVAAGVEGGCLRAAEAAAAAEPTVGLSLFYNGGTDNMAAATPPADGQPWQNIDTECFVYAADGAPGTRWPVETWRSDALGDWWTLASPASRAAAQAAGYARVGGVVGFTTAAPPPPPDVESYAYVLRVEWA